MNDPFEPAAEAVAQLRAALDELRSVLAHAADLASWQLGTGEITSTPINS